MNILGPVTLLILDGFGDAPPSEHNAPTIEGMRYLNKLRSEFPSAQLQTSGEAVGLPRGQFGNSEVGHMNLGAGRIVRQDITEIDSHIDNRQFFSNPYIQHLFRKVKEHDKTLHLIGLVSDGGVHSHEKHLHALTDWANEEGISTCIHVFTDGRDTAQKNAKVYLDKLQNHIADKPLITIGSLCGRHIAMDRDQRWDRTEQIWKLLVQGESVRTVDNALDAIENAYRHNETDEFISTTKLGGFRSIKDGDGVLFFNFRADRARQLAHAIADEDFKSFLRPIFPKVNVTTLTRYDKRLDACVNVAFSKEPLQNILGDVVSRQGWKQFRTAESEKYAHVTYFFNGGEEQIFPGEVRRVVPSPKIATYDLQPKMSCEDVTRGLVAAIQSKDYRFLVCNLANGDMVGHTGDLRAAIEACRTLDQSIAAIAEATLECNGALLITADHGNCECMVDIEGNPHTAHTLNPVPAVLIAKDLKGRTMKSGSLQDVAPTLIKILNLVKPSEMTGVSLI